MKPWNLVPRRDRVSPGRRVVVAAAWVMSVCAGAAWVAWHARVQGMNQVRLQADVLAAQAQLGRLKAQLEQQRADQQQRQQDQARLQQLNALRQHALRLGAVQQAALRQWPAAVHVQSWRIEGRSWQLQGVADSGVAVQGLTQALSPWGPWQQAPSLVELAALPVAESQTPGRVRYVVQALWREDDALSERNQGTSRVPAVTKAPP